MRRADQSVSFHHRQARSRAVPADLLQRGGELGASLTNRLFFCAPPLLISALPSPRSATLRSASKVDKRPCQALRTAAAST